jgi:Xaa-Pro aminopeptidase
MTVFEQRTRECQRRLRDRGASGVVLFPSPNLYYLGGFHESPGERHLFLFVPADGDPAFVAPALYDDQLRDATWVEDVRCWSDVEDPLPLIEATADDLGMTDGELLVDPTMWARFITSPPSGFVSRYGMVISLAAGAYLMFVVFSYLRS